MDEELKKTRSFADLVERRTGVRLEDAEAHALRLRLVTLYRLLIRDPPRCSMEENSESDCEAV